MNVKRVVPSGFCKGVVSAVNLAKKTRISNPDTPIYILGNIVHNSYVTEELTKLGIVTLDDSKCSRYELLDQIDSGIVILTAHGTADAVKNKALKKGLTVVDGTCKDVTDEPLRSIATKDNEYLFVNSEADYDAVIGTNPPLRETLEPYNVEKLYKNDEQLNSLSEWFNNTYYKCFLFQLIINQEDQQDRKSVVKTIQCIIYLNVQVYIFATIHA